jgi:hypothetical protein
MYIPFCISYYAYPILDIQLCISNYLYPIVYLYIHFCIFSDVHLSNYLYPIGRLPRRAQALHAESMEIFRTMSARFPDCGEVQLFYGEVVFFTLFPSHTYNTRYTFPRKHVILSHVTRNTQHVNAHVTRKHTSHVNTSHGTRNPSHVNT